MFSEMRLAIQKTDVHLIKIIVPIKLHEEIKRDLKTVNINAATLFPGLEGFARSLKFYV